MHIPAKITKLINDINKHGFDAYIVGGAVRNFLMKIPPKDYDICTNARPDDFSALFAEYKTVPTGLKHGTITVMLENEAVEVTTYRIDGKYFDHRRPNEVYFTADLKADLMRRDFTMNAIAMGADGKLIDPFGGKDDISVEIIRAVGNPAERFNEDALRIMRAIRFASAYGFEIENATSDAVLSCKNLLSSVSAERIASELGKILCGTNAASVMRKYRSVIAVFLPEITPMFDFAQNSKYHHLDVYEHTLAALESAQPELVMRLTMLFHDIGKPLCYTEKSDDSGHFYGHAKISADIAEKALKRLKFPTEIIEKVKILIYYHDLPLDDSDIFVKRWTNRLGKELFDDFVKVHIADDMGKKPEYQDRISGYKNILARAERLEAEKACFSLKNLAVNGNDIVALGASGKAVGFLLETLLDDVLCGRLPNEKDKLVSAAKKHLIVMK